MAENELRMRIEFCEKQIALLERLIMHLHGLEKVELESLYKYLLDEVSYPSAATWGAYAGLQN